MPREETGGKPGSSCHAPSLFRFPFRQKDFICDLCVCVWKGKVRGLVFVPSKIRTAVAKSFTLRAALSAASMTEGEGTRSYAKALLRLRFGNG